jgi:hypothetical protein
LIVGPVSTTAVWSVDGGLAGASRAATGWLAAESWDMRLTASESWQAAAGARGELLVAWSEPGEAAAPRLRSRRREARAPWGATHTIPVRGTPRLIEPIIATPYVTGFDYAAWRQSGGAPPVPDGTWSSASVDHGPWLPSTMVTGAQATEIALASDGWTVVLSSADAAAGGAGLRAVRFDRFTWISPEAIDVGTAAAVTPVGVVMQPGGNATTVWRRDHEPALCASVFQPRVSARAANP